MHIPTRSCRLTACLVAFSLLCPAPGLAKNKGQGHGGGSGHDERYEHEREDQGGKHGKGKRKRTVVYKVKGGPPPWAPAHGYRYQYEDDHHRSTTREQTTVVVRSAPVVYTAPVGIDVGRCNREQVGAVLGGALGGIAGSNVGKGTGRTAAIIGGTVIGVLVGGSIGRAMDDLDQACIGQVLEHAPSGERVRWVDPDKKTTYDVVPTDTWEDTSGRYCREYQTTATVGGKSQQVYGTACRQPDGSWEIVK